MLVDSEEADKEEKMPFFKHKLTRRQAIGKSALAAGAAIGAAIIAGSGGYFAGTSVSPGQAKTTTIVSTVSGSTTQAISLGITPADRAVNAVKALQAAGKIPAGAKIRFLEAGFRAGNMTPKAGEVRKDPFTGNVVQNSIDMLKKWESLTGIPVEIDYLNDLELYDKAITESTTKAGTWDFLGERIDFLVDFINSGVALDLTDFEAK